MEHQSTLVVNYRSTPCSRFLFSAPPLDTAETTDAEVKATRGGTKWLWRFSVRPQISLVRGQFLSGICIYRLSWLPLSPECKYRPFVSLYFPPSHQLTDCQSLLSVFPSAYRLIVSLYFPPSYLLTDWLSVCTFRLPIGLLADCFPRSDQNEAKSSQTHSMWRIRCWLIDTAKIWNRMTASVLKQDLNTKRLKRTLMEDLPSTEISTKTQPKQDKFFSLIFHRF